MYASRTIALALGLVLAIVSLNAGHQAPSLEPLNDGDAYAVLRELLTNHWPMSYHRAKRWVIQEETTVVTACADTLASVGDEWQGAIRDFRQRNAHPHAVQRGQTLGRPYVVVPKIQIEKSFSSVPDAETFGWKGFYRTYPESGGYIQLSVVGFDAGHTKAVAYVGHHCGGLCGGGRVYFLENRQGHWQPTPLIRCWWES